MADECPKCRLAATVIADVVVYSCLMETAEAGTLAVLKERRKTVLEPVLCSHEGRIANVTGDGVLVEFASAVNAVWQRWDCNTKGSRPARLLARIAASFSAPSPPLRLVRR